MANKEKSVVLAAHGVNEAEKKNYLTALSYLSKAINLYPQDSRYFINRSFVYYNLQLFQSSLEDAERAIQLESMSSKGFYRKALALIALKKYADAEKAFITCLNFDPDCEETRNGLYHLRYIILRDSGHTEEKAKQLGHKYKSVHDCMQLLYVNNAKIINTATRVNGDVINTATKVNGEAINTATKVESHFKPPKKDPNEDNIGIISPLGRGRGRARFLRNSPPVIQTPQSKEVSMTSIGDLSMSSLIFCDFEDVPSNTTDDIISVKDNHPNSEQSTDTPCLTTSAKVNGINCTCDPISNGETHEKTQPSLDSIKLKIPDIFSSDDYKEPTNILDFHGLFVGNLAGNNGNCEPKLIKLISTFGKVIKTKFMAKKSEPSFAFVDFDNPVTPVKVIAALRNDIVSEIAFNKLKPLVLRFSPSETQINNGLITRNEAINIAMQNDECFFWRSLSGCNSRCVCHLQHIRINRGIDHPWTIESKLSDSKISSSPDDNKW